MKTSMGIFAGLLAAHLSFAAVQTPIDCHVFYDGTNTIEIKWNAYPGKSYVVQQAPSLLGPWTSSAPLVATADALAQTFPTTSQVRFFKVTKLDTEGPEIEELSPPDGGIAVDRQATISVVLTDLNGVNPDSLILRVGTNAPVTLADARLNFTDNRLTYTPGSNEFIGPPAAFLTNRLIVADTLGNWSTNDWSFQLALETVPSTSIVFINDASGPTLQGGGSDLTLVSKDGDTWTFSYSGASCGLVNGQHLVNPDLQTGYTRTVVSFTDHPGTTTVRVVTRPTKLAELLDSGSLQGAAFSEISNAGPTAQGELAPGLNFHHNHNLGRKLYQDANFVIGLLPSSQLDLDAAFDINANFKRLKLSSFEAVFRGRADFTLEAYAYATGAGNWSGEIPLITPIHKVYGTMIGMVPVWVELVFEINAGYELHLEGSAGYTNGFTAVKTIKAGRRWDASRGWITIWDNPALGFTRLGPKWQVEASGNLQVWLQPKVTVYAYSAAGAWVDLKPYAELDASLQLNPHQFQLGLYGGLTSTVELDLRGWDDSWGALPSHTFDLIPRTLIWEYDSMAVPPRIISPPQPQAVSVGDTATFTVQAGGPALSYRWQRNGLNLTEDGRITGTRSRTLRIVNARTSDAGNYRVQVSNPHGSVTSPNAPLTVHPDSVSPGMAYIPAGAFQMGDSFNEGDTDERPRHTVFVSAFFMDKTLVTRELWLAVRTWGEANAGYAFVNAGSFKGANHPVHSINWYDAVKWCNARSEREGLTPCYYTDTGWKQIYKTGQTAPYVKWNANGYRLPTEAEWEKAARGGLSGRRFPWGDTITHSQANYYSRTSYAYDLSPTRGYHPTWATGSRPYTSPVDAFPPHGYGLHDMAGNLREWCWDWYDANWYANSQATQDNPRGPASGTFRLLRGGLWNYTAYTRCANRSNGTPSNALNSLGFRCLRGL